MKNFLVKTGIIGILLTLSPVTVAAAGAGMPIRSADRLVALVTQRDERIGFVRSDIVASKTRAPATTMVVPLKRAQWRTTQAKTQQLGASTLARAKAAERVSSRERRRLYFEQIAKRNSK